MHTHRSLGLGVHAEFAMAAGDFLEIFDETDPFDVVMTCFFIDTAHNVFDYVEKIASIVPEGGHWINLGPLLWHFASSSLEHSVEPTWDDIRPAIERFFTFDEEQVLEDITYTGSRDSLMRTVYRCIFFVATRNKTLLPPSPSA